MANQKASLTTLNFVAFEFGHIDLHSDFEEALKIEPKCAENEA